MLTDATKRVVQRLWDMNILPHNVDDAEEFKQQVGTLIQSLYFGQEPHPAEGLEPGKFYKRTEDMSPDGNLTLFIEEDGDVIVSISESASVRGVTRQSASIQFCSVGSGGGRSPNTREALLSLCHAIERDNAERK